MADEKPSLPAWAEHAGDTDQGIPRIDVDAGAMYPAILAEYEAHYAENVPADWLKSDGELYAEWAECLDGLDAEEPTRYWAEVAYQSMKLDLQLAMRSFTFEIRIHDSEKAYAQANLAPGRAMDRVPGGVPDAEAELPGKSTTTEGREHFKRLRGMLPG